MSDGSKIEWTDATWNPTTGCDRVSPGCDHCYALTLAERFRGTPGHYFEQGFDVQLRPDKLDQPLRWKKPRRIFVNSMSDLFHKEIPDEYVAKVFAVMAMSRRHTFQVLTKRHARMRSLLSSESFWREVRLSVTRDLDRIVEAVALVTNPLPNVWLGVSAEDQHWADIRIPALLDTPAAVRFVSAEPLLGPIDLALDDCDHIRYDHYEVGCWRALDWVIVGGESGRGARLMDLDWVRDLRDDCSAASIAFFYKQQGSGDGGAKSRRELDGRTWDEYPVAS